MVTVSLYSWYRRSRLLVIIEDLSVIKIKYGYIVNFYLILYVKVTCMCVACTKAFTIIII